MKDLLALDRKMTAHWNKNFNFERSKNRPAEDVDITGVTVESIKGMYYKGKKGQNHLKRKLP